MRLSAPSPPHDEPTTNEELLPVLFPCVSILQELGGLVNDILLSVRDGIG